MRKDTKVVVDRTRSAIEAVLSRMSRAELEVLVAALGGTSLTEAAEGQERALAQAQRRSLSTDLAVMRQILGPPFQDSVANRDDERSLRTIRDELVRLDAALPAADAIAALEAEPFNVARNTLDEYVGLASWIEWDKFAEARTKLAKVQKEVVQRGEQEEREKAEKAERAKEQKAKARIVSLIKSAANAEIGNDANVKCLMILPTGQEKTGHSGWRSTGGALHTAVADLVKRVQSKGEWDKDACAEIDAINILMNEYYPAITRWDQIPQGIVSRAFEARSRSGAYAWYDRDACLNCRQWLAIIKADFIVGT